MFNALAIVICLANVFITATATPVTRDSSGVSPFTHQVPIFVGTFTNDDGELFDLYDDRTNQDESTALEAYLSHLEAESVIEKRDWKDCQGLSTVQTACCHTAHGFGYLIKNVGIPAFSGFVTAKINEATTNGRDHQKPRSICHSLDNQNVCVSWANYNWQALKNGESADMAGFAAQCAAKGWSSEFQGTTADGATIYICVSNRGGGCHANVG